MRQSKFMFLRNYILVKVEGLHNERLINLATKSNLHLKEVKRLNLTTLQLKITFKDYKKLNEISKKTNSRVRIIKKNGFEFIINKLKRRKSFIIGAILFIAMVMLLSSFIYKIEITGCKKIKKIEVVRALRNAGFREGSIKYNLNLRNIEESLIKQIDQISMVNIKVIGTKASVEIIERTMPPVLITTPANIVATKDGIISRIIALKGQAKADEGEYVKKGQMLVSGIVVDDLNVPVQTVHAKGEVLAKIWYESIQKVYFKHTFYTKTGRTGKKVYFKYKGKTFYLKKDKIVFPKYDKIVNIKNYRLIFSNKSVQKITETYYEKAEKVKLLNYKEAIKIAEAKIQSELSTKVPKNVKIVDQKNERNITKDFIKIRRLIVTEEKIGTEVPIK